METHLILAKRVIPTILTDKGQLVKGEGFKCDRVVGNALQASRIHAMRGVDELMILDVTATKEGREPDYEMVKKLSDGCFAPLTVGGGVKTEEHVRKLLRAGADKVCISSLYYKSTRKVKEITDKYGSQCVTLSVDVRGEIDEKKYTLVEDDLLHILADAESMGVGEILLQSVSRDGTMSGYDLSIIKRASDFVGIPVIASGGCGGYEDAYQAIKAGASAVAVGALFLFEDKTPKGMAQYLKAKGVEVRL